MKPTHALLRTSLTLVLALALSGCGNSVLGPDPTGGGTGGTDPGTAPLAGPEILVIEEAEPVRYTRYNADPSTEVGTTPGSRELRVSAMIDGAVGGRVQCGRFLLSIPAGAFAGEGEISMAMPDSTVMIVDIEIDPVELNDFNETVKLCLLTDGTGLNEEDLQIYWWDPDKSEWTAMGCEKDLSAITETTEGILTHLSHFSRYSGGKAGW